MSDNTDTSILDLINKATDNSASAAAEAADKLKQFSASMSQSTDSLLTNILGGTNQGKTPLALETELQANLQAQQNNRQLYESVNNNQGFPALVNQQMGLMQDKLNKAQELAESVEQRESVGFFDNPLGFIINQIYLPDERNALKATLDSANLAKKRIEDTNQLMQTSAISENAFKQSLSAEANKSLVDAMRHDIGAKADAASIDAGRTNSAAVNNTYNMTKEQLELRRQQQAAEAAEQSMDIARTAEAERKARFDDWLRQSKENINFSDQATNWYNLAAEKFGRPKLTSDKITALLKTQGPVAEATKVLLYAGQTIEQTGQVTYGATPYTAVQTMATLKTQTSDSQKWISETTDAGFAESKKAAINGQKDPIALQKVFDKAAQDKLNEYQPVRFKNLENPFIVQAPQAFLDTTPPAIEQTKVWSTVLKPKVESGALKTSDPGLLVDYVILAVNEGKISLGEAASGIATYYNSAMQLNNDLRQFKKSGYQEQSDYKVVTDTLRPEVNRFLPKGTSARTFNFTDLTDVNAYLLARGKDMMIANKVANTYFGD